YGGPPKLASDLARQLARRGHAVTVCTTDALDARRVSPLEETLQGVRVVRFRNVSNWLAYRLKVFLPVGLRRGRVRPLAGVVVAHLFETRTLLNAWAAGEATRQHVPFVLSALGSLPRGSGWRGLLKGRYDRKYLRALLGKAGALLAQNDHERRLYAE